MLGLLGGVGATKSWSLGRSRYRYKTEYHCMACCESSSTPCFGCRVRPEHCRCGLDGGGLRLHAGWGLGFLPFVACCSARVYETSSSWWSKHPEAIPVLLCVLALAWVLAMADTRRR